ncbi:MAG: hypothetical protein K8I30_06015 [Anaerolineae bacterium]|nr:hypothetical protein [Anaerolineae bacterium]
MVKHLNGTNPLIALYGVAIIMLGFVAFSAITNAFVVRDAESAFGHPLSCWDAYQYRAIDSYFYPDRRLQGDALYIYSLFAPCLFLGFVGLTGVIVIEGLRQRMMSARFRNALILLAGIGTVVLVVLLAYAPVIETIACATE